MNPKVIIALARRGNAMLLSRDVVDWLEWRRDNRRKRRTMTMREYRCWCKIGDQISSPAEVNPFPGGLTVTFEDASDGRIIGNTDERYGLE